MTEQFTVPFVTSVTSPSDISPSQMLLFHLFAPLYAKLISPSPARPPKFTLRLWSVVPSLLFRSSSTAFGADKALGR